MLIPTHLGPAFAAARHTELRAGAARGRAARTAEAARRSHMAAKEQIRERSLRRTLGAVATGLIPFLPR